MENISLCFENRNYKRFWWKSKIGICDDEKNDQIRIVDVEVAVF
ncbi:MAG: hypothetical protein ACPGVH_06150 [Chitinophagales bacterium]